ncbi:peptide chain release factor N(5)-glutamine methyltransferase [Inediibacterium massiliense]|uniref:peptide chain release factor N(5)-glutamine methyltransferase n=1 Tax=Inediibacterium massiliense TaxID=1658111 RepID=UPI000A745E70|nr:peptide chain release factor N(5)-glutamine methyltransferase [Inediibacterium massiliense]
MAVNMIEILKSAVKKLEGNNIQTPLLDAEVILCDLLKKDKIFIFTHRDYVLNDEEEKMFWKCIDQRIKGVPVQYIIKKQEFMGLDFYVEEGVLIPRPDTEILVEEVIDWAKNRNTEKIRVVDLGTGSGAISVSLSKYIKKSFVYAVDLSLVALSIAKKNAKENEVEIIFLQGDLFEPLKNLKEKLDIVVSNPPYIPKEDIKTLQVEVQKYEPILALDGGEDGLDYYRRIIDQSPLFLRDKGLLALEVGHDQADEVISLMKMKGCYENIKKIKDLSGIERVITATLCESTKNDIIDC